MANYDCQNRTSWTSMGVSGFSLVWLLLLLLLACCLLLECDTVLLLLLDVDWLVVLFVSCWTIFSTSKLTLVTSLMECLDSVCSSCNWWLLGFVLLELSRPLYAANIHPEAIREGLNIMNSYSETKRTKQTTLETKTK